MSGRAAAFRTARASPAGTATAVAALVGLGIVLVLFALAAHGPRLGLVFVGDDYVFLDKTRTASFPALWSPARSVDFGWYRPWSRELYFWSLQRLFGTNAAAFRGANVALWIAALALYAAVIARLASRRVAAIAVSAVASLAFWGTPLLWISGSQDLWMLVFAMLSLLLVVAGRVVWAIPSFALALLSKETAGVLPALFCSYLIIHERRTWTQALKTTAPFWCVLLIWGLLHPTLRLRFFGALASTAEIHNRPAWSLIVVKDAAASLNIDRLPHPQEVTAGVIVTVLETALLLGGGLLLALLYHRRADPAPDLRRPWMLAFAWVVIGWLPTLLPSIGWHGYYGCLGALGLWFGLALWLDSRPAAAVALVTALVLLRGGHANTLSSDWGDETYFRRAGTTLAAIRADLFRQHPSFPPHSRVYFSEIPQRIGLVAGTSPALRVWYADSTLQAGYYSYFRPRARGESPGRDYFFRFDSTAGMVEVKTGAEDVPRALSVDRAWESDHVGLAGLFLAKGDLDQAALEFEKLSQLPERPGAAVFASVCRRLLGDTVRADSLIHAAQVRLRMSDAEIEAFASRIRARIVKARSFSP